MIAEADLTEAALRLKYQKQRRSEQAAVFDWPRHARDNQLPPDGDWTTWLFLAGRGTGKTRAGAEWVRMNIDAGTASRIALVGPTAADVRDVMIEGESGILAISPPWNRPQYEPSKRRLTWPNGAIATAYSADEPDRLRGPQHDLAWTDEPAAWRYPETWDNLMFGLRLGADPRAMATTTPRPVRLIRELLQQDTTAVTTGNTYENRDNLAPAFLEQIIRRYEGTRLGRQEIMGELLEDIPGALWERKRVDELRVKKPPELTRIVVAIDPAMTSGEDADETGIVVAGLGDDGDGYVLTDRTCRMSPAGWGNRAITALDEFTGDRIVAEVNNGGDMVEHTLRSIRRSVPYKAVHASRGKRARAEPIAALYEQGRIHHVGSHPDLEDQMCTYVPDGVDYSPDRVDALVWALTDLMLGSQGRFRPL